MLFGKTVRNKLQHGLFPNFEKYSQGYKPCSNTANRLTAHNVVKANDLNLPTIRNGVKFRRPDALTWPFALQMMEL